MMVCEEESSIIIINKLTFAENCSFVLEATCYHALYTTVMHWSIESPVPQAPGACGDLAQDEQLFVSLLVN